MTRVDHLQPSGVAQMALDFQWDVRTGDRFMSVRAEDKPKLADAIGAINDRALFGLTIACTEWTVARVSERADAAKVQDALWRIDAAWAGLIDARYAELPEPDDSEEETAESLAVNGPIWAATIMMGDAFVDGLKPGHPVVIFQVALGLCQLAEYVCGRSPAFKSWLPETLRRLQQTHPADSKPVSEQKPATLADFRPAGAPSIFEGLEPGQNPYLRSAAELRQAGVVAPYGDSP